MGVAITAAVQLIDNDRSARGQRSGGVRRGSADVDTAIRADSENIVRRHEVAANVGDSDQKCRAAGADDAVEQDVAACLDASGVIRRHERAGPEFRCIGEKVDRTGVDGRIGRGSAGRGCKDEIAYGCRQHAADIQAARAGSVDLKLSINLEVRITCDLDRPIGAVDVKAAAVGFDRLAWGRRAGNSLTGNIECAQCDPWSRRIFTERNTPRIVARRIDIER